MPLQAGPAAKLVLVAAALAAVAFLARALPVKPVLEAAAGWGWWGPVAFGAVYVGCCLALVPGTIPTLAGGALFGAVTGSITVSIASTAGATLAMLAGRYLARGVVSRRLAGSARLAAVDRAVARNGFRIVLLLRLSPVFPFNVLNYALGLTPVTVRDFVLASWLGMLPATVLYVSLGAAGRQAVTGDHARSPAEWALLGAGALATLAVTLLVTRAARRALREPAPGVTP